MPFCLLTYSCHTHQRLPSRQLGQYPPENLNKCSGILQQKVYIALQSKFNYSGSPRHMSSIVEVILCSHPTHTRTLKCTSSVHQAGKSFRPPNWNNQRIHLLGLPWQMIFDWSSEQCALVGFTSKPNVPFLDRERGEKLFHCPCFTSCGHSSLSRCLSRGDLATIMCLGLGPS